MIAKKTETAVFGGGCFWCTEAVFNSLKGVVKVIPGYTGGSITNPTYEQVSSGNTGHVESAKIDFDPAVISYDDLLAVFFNTHDPTTMNQQGNDVGTQYASVIFYTNEEQKKKGETLIAELNNSRAHSSPVITDVRHLQEFYEAENYHQKYYDTHKDAPYCQIVIAPKMEKLEKKFAELLKQ